MSRMSKIFCQSFFDTFSGRALFGQLRMPGEPDEFIDSRPLEEFLRSDDFLEVQAVFHASKQEPADVEKAVQEFYDSRLGPLTAWGGLFGEVSREARGGLASLLDASSARVLHEAAQRKYKVQPKHA